MRWTVRGKGWTRRWHRHFAWWPVLVEKAGEADPLWGYRSDGVARNGLATGVGRRGRDYHRPSEPPEPAAVG